MGSAQAGCVVVVGGGVIGMSIAVELAHRGREVTLVDPSPGRGASWAAAGMLSAAAEVAPGEEPLLAELDAASRLWPAFAERLAEDGGVDVDFSTAGSLLVGVSRSDAREVARLAGLAAAAGRAVEPLDAERLTALEPTLGALAPGAWLLPEDHYVDNRLVVEGLLAACKALGVAILEDRCVELDARGARLRCRLEHHGDLDAERCVLATGASAPLPGTEGLGLPRVRPVRGCTLRLRPARDEALPTHTIRAVVDGVFCYLVPRADHTLVVGATSEEDAGADVVRAGGIWQLLDTARRVLPVLDELHFAEASVGLRPATDDHLPFVGPLRDPRVVGAIGHYRNGILLAPLAALRAADAIDA